MKVTTRAVTALALLLSVAPLFADVSAAKPKSPAVAQKAEDRDAAKKAYADAVRAHGKTSPEAKAAKAKLVQARKAYRSAAGLPLKGSPAAK